MNHILCILRSLYTNCMYKDANSKTRRGRRTTILQFHSLTLHKEDLPGLPPKISRVYRYEQRQRTIFSTRDHKEIEHQIINFIIESKEKGMKRISIMNYTCPVIKFLQNKRYNAQYNQDQQIHAAQIKSKKTFGYTHEQIQKLLDIADERMRVVILLASLAAV